MVTAAARGLVVGVAVVLAAAGVAGCGGGGGGADTGGKAKAAASHSAPAETPMAVPADVRPLTQAQLEQAVVGAKDVPGWHTGSVTGRSGDGVQSPVNVRNVKALPAVSPAACAPLYYTTLTLARQQHGAVVEQMVMPVADKDPRALMMSLKSYAPADAAQLMADLRTALRTCTSFASPEPGQSWGSPKRLADPKLGDEALSYHLVQTVPSVDDKGDEDGGAPVHGRFHFVVVRSGATVAVYYVTGADDDPGFPEVPMAVVTAQTAKLAKAAAR
ncbi:hypothetical protein [Streptomyces sp. NPDC021020]|uniref:hypothetical protein n=1 Tax=Streptomyces sp. NPDC021020 TaxID=3365109 RepID=UPI0037A77D8E